VEALRSNIEHVVVSTEDEEIASMAGAFGAEVPFRRPQALAEDEASSLSVLLHALSFCEHEGCAVRTVVFLPPTSPFRTADQINAGLDLLHGSDVDSVVTVTEVSEHPYYVYSMDEQGMLHDLISLDHRPLRRQDLPPFYALADGVVFSRRSYYEGVAPTAPIFNPKSMKGLVVDSISAISIDTEHDFALAEFWLATGRVPGFPIIREDISKVREQKPNLQSAFCALNFEIT
jgi:CMP-N-acetylneuraminic acid synthetase